MCGRFSLTASPEDVEELFGLLDVEPFPERYNIAPTQPILIVMTGESQADGSNLPDRKSLLVKWGFLPGWVKDPREFPLLINARSETAIEKASFRNAMRHRRILIPASGFYEWWRPPKGSKEKSQAYWVKPRQGGIVAFGGVMETWSSPDGSELDTACVLTRAANERFAAIHHRMPVVIQPENFARWLDCKTQEPRHVKDLMGPVAEDFFEAVPVSDLVNKVANAGPEVQTAIDPALVVKSADRPQKTDKKTDASDQMNLF